MKPSKIISTLAIMFFLFTASLIKPLYSYAHCDTLDGPVVAEARQNLWVEIRQPGTCAVFELAEEP